MKKCVRCYGTGFSYCGGICLNCKGTGLCPTIKH